jgi:licheninase
MQTMSIKFSVLLIFGVFFCLTAIGQTKTNFKPVKVKPLTVKEFRTKWEMVWADEFEGTGLPDDRIWNYDIGGHGWGNNELQFYTEKRTENVRRENGNLVIETRKEQWEKNAYTSARITTKRKKDLTYGRWEVKAKFSGGKGSWPAIWLLPSYRPYGNNMWPDNGEIDIMEHVGWKPGTIHGTIHTKAYNHTKKTEMQFITKAQDFDTQFHVYAVEVTPTEVKFFMDDLQYGSFKNDKTGNFETWPYDLPMHLVLNMAVGGWGGQEGIDENIFPLFLIVDYVRCYRPVED